MQKLRARAVPDALNTETQSNGGTLRETQSNGGTLKETQSNGGTLRETQAMVVL